MSIKFVSKNSNYMLVLRPGIEGNRALGTHAVSGLYVKFQAGIVDVKEESIVEQLRAHPSFGIDFIEVKQDEVDPFIDTREEVEPSHNLTELKYGHAEALIKTPGKVKMTAQLKKIIEKEALKMMPGLLKSNPKILKDLIMGLASEMKDAEAPVAAAPIDEEVKESIVKAPVTGAKKVQL